MTDHESRRCRECLSPIPDQATRCAHCGVAQHKWWETSGGAVVIVAAVLAVVIGILAWDNYQTDREAEGGAPAVEIVG